MMDVLLDDGLPLWGELAMWCWCFGCGVAHGRLLFGRRGGRRVRFYYRISTRRRTGLEGARWRR